MPLKISMYVWKHRWWWPGSGWLGQVGSLGLLLCDSMEDSKPSCCPLGHGKVEIKIGQSRTSSPLLLFRDQSQWESGEVLWWGKPWMLITPGPPCSLGSLDFHLNGHLMIILLSCKVRDFLERNNYQVLVKVFNDSFFFEMLTWGCLLQWIK